MQDIVVIIFCGIFLFPVKVNGRNRVEFSLIIVGDLRACFLVNKKTDCVKNWVTINRSELIADRPSVWTL